MSEFLSTILFWVLAILTLGGGIAVVCFRNPVSSALSVVTCFVGLAGLFITLSGFFVGVIQILVYSGAVMVLFLFIIMLLDLKTEKMRVNILAPTLAGLTLVAAFAIQLIGVLTQSPNKTVADAEISEETLKAAASNFNEGSKIAESLEAGRLPDVHLIGHTLFTDYNLPLQILGVLLLVATVGVVVLSKKSAE